MSGPDVVYPVRAGERNDELRYSLRSLEHLPHGRVHMIGFAPTWVDQRRVRVLPASRGSYLPKWAVVSQHILDACLDAEISDPFILMNDDMYIMERLEHLPLLNRGRTSVLVEQLRAAGVDSDYVDSMLRTRDELERYGFPDPLSFELHTPITVYKGAMREAIAIGNGIRRWNRRTAFGALFGCVGETIADVKVLRRGDPIPPGPLLSSSDYTFPWVLPHLRKLFPFPGIYER